MSTALLPLPDFFRRYTSRDQSWKNIVFNAQDLPPLAMSAARSVSLLDIPQVSASKLSETIAMDPALAARTLRLANSRIFRRTRAISTLEEAVMILGLKNLRGSLISATLQHYNRQVSRAEELIWQNSLATAYAAREISRRLRLRCEEEMYLIGLLHDFGKLVLLHRSPDQYNTKILESTRAGVTFAEAERKATRNTHSLIGALVAKKWNFLDEHCFIILKHHEALKGYKRGDTVDADLKRCVLQLADAITHELKIGHDEGYPSQKDVMTMASKQLGLNQNEVDDVSQQVLDEFKGALKILQIPV